MPELDKSNLKDAVYTRFVRSGETIYFIDNDKQTHADFVGQHLSDKHIDDAGFLEPEDGKLIPMDGSSSLGISEYNDGREETERILSDLQ